MSRRPMPWFKMYGSIIEDEDYLLMPLEQRAVYLSLMCLACKSRPRGTFQTEDLRKLANRVADGRLDVLKATLTYCTTKWKTEDGTTTIVISEDRGRFTKWKKHEPPSDHPLRVKFRSQYKVLRDLVFARDPNLCAKCGATNRLALDHVQPLAKGGSNDPANLQILCTPCNSRKGVQWS